jgi:hypothetical protein
MNCACAYKAATFCTVPNVYKSLSENREQISIFDPHGGDTIKTSKTSFHPFFETKYDVIYVFSDIATLPGIYNLKHDDKLYNFQYIAMLSSCLYVPAVMHFPAFSKGRPNYRHISPLTLY